MNSQLLNLFSNARLNERPLILDGSMGALLQQMGFNRDPLSWMTPVIYESPETIIRIHEEYIVSGSEIITTHTFRTNPLVIGEQKSKQYVKKAVELAIEAVLNTSVLIAGSNPPAEDCYQAKRTINHLKLENNHCNHIDLLTDSGVDFILNETQSHRDEIELICKHCSKHNISYIVSLYFNENLNLLSGESINYIIDLIWDYNPLAIGFNCIAPKLFNLFMKNYQTENNWGFYLNCGAGTHIDNDINCGISPKEYPQIVNQYLIKYPSFVGACCGSSPEHIKYLHKVING